MSKENILMKYCTLKKKGNKVSDLLNHIIFGSTQQNGVYSLILYFFLGGGGSYTLVWGPILTIN